MLNRRQQYGEAGEALAARLLRRQGYRILETNYRTPIGEIDIIARERDTIVFVEVKARRSLHFGHPKTAVTARQAAQALDGGALLPENHRPERGQGPFRRRGDLRPRPNGRRWRSSGMPSISSMDKRDSAAVPGTLYVVATPIGNLEDITLRALSVLRAVDLVAAEDTRKTAQLLRHFDISVPLLSYYDHNETVRAPELVDRLRNGAAIALVTTAGTPCISDPGYRVVAAAAAAGLPVVPVPGPSAAAAALSASGLPTDAFVFEGFLPKKPGKRATRLKALATDPRTLILYESPQRILALVESMLPVFGNRPAVLARELTKRYEEFVRGGLGDILDNPEAARRHQRRMHPSRRRQSGRGGGFLGGRPGGDPQGVGNTIQGAIGVGQGGGARARTAAPGGLRGSTRDQVGTDRIRLGIGRLP